MKIYEDMWIDVCFWFIDKLSFSLFCITVGLYFLLIFKNFASKNETTINPYN